MRKLLILLALTAMAVARRLVRFFRRRRFFREEGAREGGEADCR